MALTTATFQYFGQDPNSGIMFVFIAFAAVALWSTVSLTVRIMATLKRRSGLYFWSVLTTSWGLCIRQIGVLTSFLARRCPWILRLVITQLGWVMVVSGFSMVLYSRLNFILQDRRTRLCVLGLIIFNGVIWHTAMTTISAGKAKENYAGNKARLHAWKKVDVYFERVQIVMFSMQEIIISLLYVHAAYQYLQGRFADKNKTREHMGVLLLVQCIVIAIDIAVVAVDFAGFLQLKIFLMSFAYSVKLELEFVGLNQLVGLSQMGVSGVSLIVHSYRYIATQGGSCE
ncbi:hypothetical protein GQ44DRAFT_684417 [Phaeosphaeriaceae sp. PMI808]|nr:hypothetical protein GQ44DRAFT_684417 [Phaeosphaeriaceae sp. PMI808]